MLSLLAETADVKVMSVSCPAEMRDSNWQQLPVFASIFQIQLV